MDLHSSDSSRYAIALGAKKQSMAQRRKNRAKRVQQENPYANFPPVKIVSKEPKDLPTDSDDKKIHAKNPSEAADKARQLLQSQRESVNMLTFVRERAELLDTTELMAALDTKGYFCVDNFLDSEDVIDKLEQECQALFDNDQMQADVDRMNWIW